MSRLAVVTGAGGFVGGRIVTGLAEAGFQVMAVTGSAAKVPPAAARHVVVDGWQGLTAALQGLPPAELWVHAAARIDYAPEAAPSLYAANVLLAEEAARLAARSDRLERFVLLSSIAAGDTALAAPPATHYGMSKLLAERLTAALLGECWAGLRLHGVFGRQETPTLFVNACLARALRGEPITVKATASGQRNYLWVGDVPTLVTTLVDERRSGLHFAAGPTPLSVVEMARRIAAAAGVAFAVDPAPGGADADQLLTPSAGLPVTPFDEALASEWAGAR